MKKVYIEVKFRKNNDIKSYEAESISFDKALKNCFEMLDKENILSETYDVLCILKSTYTKKEQH